jgi:hypothetical protein
VLLSVMAESGLASCKTVIVQNNAASIKGSKRRI